MFKKEVIKIVKRKAKKRVVKRVSKKIVNNEGKTCSWGICSGAEWFWTLVSEAAIYGFLYFGLISVGAPGTLWEAALVLLIFLNVAWFACPVVRKHFK